MNKIKFFFNPNKLKKNVVYGIHYRDVCYVSGGKKAALARAQSDCETEYYLAGIDSSNVVAEFFDTKERKICEKGCIVVNTWGKPYPNGYSSGKIHSKIYYFY